MMVLLLGGGQKVRDGMDRGKHRCRRCVSDLPKLEELPP